MSFKLNYYIVFRVLSRNLFIITIAILLSVAVGLYYSEPVTPLLISAGIAFILGFTLFVCTRKNRENTSIRRREAYFTVTLSWLIVSLVGSFPYILSGSIPHFVDAYFESVSGFTTTGSSILTNIEALPKSILFWRSLTHWIGGIGIIVLVIIVMPTLQIGGYNLFTLESSLMEKISPKIKSVGKRLLYIYLLLTVAEILLLLLGKMSLFDSICHSFGTVATGGFSTKNTSITNYSRYIQYVIMLFMLLAGTNFLVHYYLLKREFRKISQNEELKFYLAVLVLLGFIITIVLFFKTGTPFEESFRLAYFQIISIVTCTGFATADYLQWPQFVWLIILMAMFFGGCSGSTAGGIKMVRILVLRKNLRRIFTQQISPRAIVPVRLNNCALTEESNNSILTFISIYFLLFLTSTLLLIFTGIDGKTASSSVATCMAGIGPGIGSIGPANSFAHLPQVAKMILSFLMLVGRLEIYPVILLFTPVFWSK